jgi:RNase P/RNase MRP subunit p29
MDIDELNKTISTNIIGKRIKIFSAKNKFNNNKNGVIVNETKNMLYLLQEGKKLKKISKSELNLVKVSLPFGDYFINGKAFLGRPEEKI